MWLVQRGYGQGDLGGMDDWKNKVKTEAANGGLSHEDYADSTLFFHRDVPPEYRVIVPHEVRDEWVRQLYFRQLMRLAEAVRSMGTRPDAEAAIEIQREPAQSAPLRAEQVPKPVRCSVKGNDD